MVRYLYGHHYHIHPLYVTGDDFGHRGAARKRVYIFLAHKERVRMVLDVTRAFQKVSSTIRKAVQTEPQDYLVSGPHEILREAGDTAWHRNNRRLTAPLDQILVL